MELTQKLRLESAKRGEQSHDMAIMSGYSILAILLLLAIFFASSGPGTAPVDFADMSAFP
jgi:hypothetical protein